MYVHSTEIKTEANVRRFQPTTSSHVVPVESFQSHLPAVFDSPIIHRQPPGNWNIDYSTSCATSWTRSRSTSNSPQLPLSYCIVAWGTAQVFAEVEDFQARPDDHLCLHYKRWTQIWIIDFEYIVRWMDQLSGDGLAPSPTFMRFIRIQQPTKAGNLTTESNLSGVVQHRGSSNNVGGSIEIFWTKRCLFSFEPPWIFAFGHLSYGHAYIVY